MNSWIDVCERVGKAFVEEVKAIPRVTIKEFLRSKVKVGAVYLIFSPTGECVYIGESKNVPARLRSHLSAGNDCGLLWHVCRQRKLTVERTYGHRCACSAFIECGKGARYVVPKTDKIKAVAAEVKETYTVLVMAQRGAASARLLTSLLKPQYYADDSIG